MIKRTVLLVLLGCCLALAAEDAAVPANLFPNGDFEGERQGWPQPTDSIVYETEDGNTFLRLQSLEPGKMILVYRRIDIPAGLQAAELTYRVRYADIKPGQQAWYDGRIMMKFKGADGKEVKGAPSAPYFRGTKDEWQLRTQHFRVPEGATMLEFMPCLFQVKSGRLDFDDFKLTAISPELIDKEEVERAQAARARNKRAADGPIIANGDFETDKKGDGAPDGWLSKNSDEVSGAVDEIDGNHYLHFSCVTPGKMVMVYRAIPLRPEDRAFELTFRVRYHGVERGEKPWFDARIMMNFKDARKHTVGPGPSAPYFRGTSEGWRTVSRKFVVPPRAVSLELMPCLFNVKAGTMDIDDLVLTPIDPESIPKRLEMASPVVEAPAADKLPPPLHVAGNRLNDPDGNEVWLQGLCVDSLEWSATGERVVQSIEVAIDQWHANAIRLPVKEEYWYGRSDYQKDGGDGYRQIVDSAVNATCGRGAYLILDLHRFRAPEEKHAEFWEDAARKYANHPGVIFELFNEPHDVSWDVWRNGGTVTDKVKPKEGVAAENQETLKSFEAVGMQTLVERIRATGARNLIIAGGLDWSYDISGVLKGYALQDTADGNGIMYSSHNYPWKKGWQDHFLNVAEKYPVFIGEVGNIRAWDDFKFIPESQRYSTEGWSEDMIGCIQKYRLNWTAFSFHPRCGPMVIQDWEYTPTPYWGVFVKRALAGEQFEMKKQR